MKEPKYIVVVGTSAGGLDALSELIQQLNEEMDAAFFIVMHLSKRGISNFLLHKLKPLTSMPCYVAEEGQPIERGQICIAPANAHLILRKNEVVIGHGPEENRWRPSIDILFRSAAAAYSSRVIGIVLTGLLTDGTSGMIAIKSSGGKCIVQDPNEAEYPDMPLSVLNHLDADYCVSLSEMGNVLKKILKQEPGEGRAPEYILQESRIAEKMATQIEETRKVSGEHAIYSCPDCGGGLWNIHEDGLVRYRCHTGHSYLESDLLAKIGERLEVTLWTALRMMEERSNLLTKMSKNYAKKGLSRLESQYSESAQELQNHIDTLKEVLIATGRLDTTNMNQTTT
jgi:two-component system, chemotaxis family, protein-glutamate methylesterase/glutaminase